MPSFKVYVIITFQISSFNLMSNHCFKDKNTYIINFLADVSICNKTQNFKKVQRIFLKTCVGPQTTQPLTVTTLRTVAAFTTPDY